MINPIRSASGEQRRVIQNQHARDRRIPNSDISVGRSRNPLSFTNCPCLSQEKRGNRAMSGHKISVFSKASHKSQAPTPPLTSPSPPPPLPPPPNAICI